MTAGLGGLEWSAVRPAYNLPRERSDTHFTGGWVGPGAGLDGQKNIVSTGIRFRTIEPLDSLYNELATRPKIFLSTEV